MIATKKTQAGLDGLMAKVAAGQSISDQELRAAGILPIAGGAKLFTGRDGAIRFYDGTSPTPYFVEVVFENADVDHPLGPPEPEQMPVYHRGRFDANSHYVEGADRSLDGLQFSFTVRLANDEPSRLKLRDVLGLDLPATWRVGAHTWTTTKGSSQRLSGGPTRELFSTPGLASGRMRTVDACYLLTDPDGGSRNIGYRLAEVYFRPDEQRLRESDDVVSINLSGVIYGAITEITSFPAGTESTG